MSRRDRGLRAGGALQRALVRPAWPVLAATLALTALVLGPTRGRAEEVDRPILHVGAGIEGAHATVQAALDVAPPGALVRVAPGVYTEHVTVQRPVTLEGAGPGPSQIVSILYRQCDLAALRRTYLPRIRMARSEAVRKRLWSELRRRERTLIRPTLLVEGTRDVRIEKLRLSGRGQREGGAIGFGEVLSVRRAEVEVRDCAVVGSPGCGIRVHEDADVSLERVLVAAVWDRGISVGDADEIAGHVHVKDCDIRNCYHRGIAIEAGSNDVLIENCRISGSAWHGIRYDDAGPTVRSNLIFDNQRMGIYAAGETRGTVEGNVVSGNHLGGMSCRPGSRDLVSRNLFTRNGGEGISVPGAARPTIEHNVFHAMPIGVLVGLDGPNPGSAGEGIRGNLFWSCDRPVWGRRSVERRGDDAPPDEGCRVTLPSAAGNRIEDPGLSVTAGLVPGLRADGRAAELGAGPARPTPSLPSPWPEQPEEASMLTALDHGCEPAR